MSYFGQNCKIRKTTLVTYFGKQYVTAKGLAMKLADDVAYRTIERCREREWKETRNCKKYGEPVYSNPAGLKKWKTHTSRLRKIAFRRILPIVEKLFV